MFYGACHQRKSVLWLLNVLRWICLPGIRGSMFTDTGGKTASGCCRLVHFNERLWTSWAAARFLSAHPWWIKEVNNHPIKSGTSRQTLHHNPPCSISWQWRIGGRSNTFQFTFTTYEVFVLYDVTFGLYRGLALHFRLHNTVFCVIYWATCFDIKPSSSCPSSLRKSFCPQFKHNNGLVHFIVLTLHHIPYLKSKFVCS